ncbi:MAG: SDR family NAD(P)-dependent oxidoreductase [Balneola sp.]|nr:MAG: SDR family NAD(P)-dependent oxidoreductase [Balneola sp.]
MNNRTWFITGISSGLGKALAKAVIEYGDYVIGTFRRQEQVDEFNKLYQNKAKALLLDITNHHLIEASFNRLKETNTRIDVLVNNAGVGFAGAIEETSTEETRKVFEANFFGALKTTREVLPVMRAQKSGHIIQISSHGGIKAFAGFGIYNASKFALEGFSEALAQETAPLNIKVTMVEPGPFRTEFAGTGLGLAETVIEDYSETAGIFRNKLKGVHGQQEGDPDKAAHAIIDMVNLEHPPLRLPLGRIPLTTIQMKLDSVQKDLDEQRSVAESVVF